MTKKIYLSDTYLFECEAVITGQGKDEKGNYILMDRTIFYPQSGGQPSDIGIIKGDNFELEVTFVKNVENEIRHYINHYQVLKYSNVMCFINKNRRLLNAKYHTSAHLLGNSVEVLYPGLKAIKGHSFPNEAYVEFNGTGELDLAKIQNEINEAIKADHLTRIFEIDPVSFEQQYYKLPYQIPEDKHFRVMQIGNLLPVPCGGTHLSSTSEIGDIKITKIKAKNDVTRITYEVHFVN